jgi:hypothetical protein
MTWLVAASALWLSACGRAPEAEKNAAPENKAESAPAIKEITLHVPGMIDRQGIT